MRKMLSLILPALLLFSCSTGFKTDMMTGLSVSYNGFTIDDAYIICDGKKLQTKNASLSSKLTIEVNKISGFNSAEGRSYPGCTMEVTDSNGKSVLHFDDLYGEYDAEGINSDSLDYVNASLTVGNPMLAGEEYTWKVKFWDKKGKAMLNAEVKLNITE